MRTQYNLCPNFRFIYQVSQISQPNVRFAGDNELTEEVMEDYKLIIYLCIKYKGGDHVTHHELIRYAQNQREARSI